MRFSSRTARERSAADDSLTPAEVRVLQLIAKGNANKEIAEQLSISEEVSIASTALQNGFSGVVKTSIRH